MADRNKMIDGVMLEEKNKTEERVENVSPEKIMNGVKVVEKGKTEERIETAASPAKMKVVKEEDDDQDLGSAKWLLLLLILGVHVAVLAPLAAQYIPTNTQHPEFYFYNSTEGSRIEFKATPAGLAQVPITSTTSVAFIVHGFTESSHRPWIRRLSHAMVERGIVVLAIDYYDLHVMYNYVGMRKNARRVADILARLMDDLVIYNHMDLSKLHVIGFSMGGRIIGMLRDRMKTGTIGRITALDPSFPFLHPVINAEQLDDTDADLVVILRTSAISYFNPRGHIDFSPNGGMVQPGCDDWYFPYTAQQFCSHFRAVTMALESVQKMEEEPFPGCGCEDYESFEEGACPCDVVTHFNMTGSYSHHGHFFLKTNALPPYSLPLPHRQGN